LKASLMSFNEFVVTWWANKDRDTGEHFISE
jgi:hypothetical protein